LNTNLKEDHSLVLFENQKLVYYSSITHTLMYCSFFYKYVHC